MDEENTLVKCELPKRLSTKLKHISEAFRGSCNFRKLAFHITHQDLFAGLRLITQTIATRKESGIWTLSSRWVLHCNMEHAIGIINTVYHSGTINVATVPQEVRTWCGHRIRRKANSEIPKIPWAVHGYWLHIRTAEIRHLLCMWRAQPCNPTGRGRIRGTSYHTPSHLITRVQNLL